MTCAIEVRAVERNELDLLDKNYPEKGRPQSRHRVRWSLQRRGFGTYLIAWRSDHPVGWVSVHRPGSGAASEHARRFNAGEIEDLFIDERFRGNGYGSSLLMAAEQTAREIGWVRLGLEITASNPHNDIARAMYERHGYRDSGVGEFESGYFYWTESGERLWDGEPHRFLIRSLR